MRTDSDIVPECIVRPGSLGGLISLYEGNFIKLASLLGGCTPAAGSRVSRCERDCDLHLQVEEGSRFTRLLRLTYVFEERDGAVAEPDMVLRSYLDARVVEVLSWTQTHHHPLLQSLLGSRIFELERRWARNIVLGKWLDYLLDNGHSFVPPSATAKN